MPEKPLKTKKKNPSSDLRRPKPTTVGEDRSRQKSSGGRYYEAIGRRKRAVARVRLLTCNSDKSVGKGNLSINGKPYKEYFSVLALQKKIEAPFIRLKSINRFCGTVKVKGGGSNGQAEAIQHGCSRALILFDSNFRKRLKKAGFLTRDPREKERRKFGLKKARKAPQWSKR